MKTLKKRVCLALTLVLMLSMILPGTANAAVISDHPLSESERRELEHQPRTRKKARTNLTTLTLTKWRASPFLKMPPQPYMAHTERMASYW